MGIGERQSIREGELFVEGDRVFVGSGEDTALELLEVQMEGKKRMPAAEFLHGYQVRTGERLGV
jgi:methionyl-tRNA formyltransferase